MICHGHFNFASTKGHFGNPMSKSGFFLVIFMYILSELSITGNPISITGKYQAFRIHIKCWTVCTAWIKDALIG